MKRSIAFHDPDGLWGSREISVEWSGTGSGDGEYIVFEDLGADGSLRPPRKRSWHVNADGRFLGADEIRALEVRP